MDSDLTSELFVQVVQNQNLWFVDTDGISRRLVYAYMSHHLAVLR